MLKGRQCHQLLRFRRLRTDHNSLRLKRYSSSFVYKTPCVLSATGTTNIKYQRTSPPLPNLLLSHPFLLFVGCIDFLLILMFPLACQIPFSLYRFRSRGHHFAPFVQSIPSFAQAMLAQQLQSSDYAPGSELHEHLVLKPFLLTQRVK